MTSEIMDVCMIDKRTYNDHDDIQDYSQEYNDDDDNAVPLIKKSRLEKQNDIIEINDDENVVKLNDTNEKKTKIMRKTNKTREIKRLKSNLKEEETKLILLKRLYYSQKFPNQTAAASTAVGTQPTTNQQQQSSLKSNQQQLNKNKALNQANSNNSNCYNRPNTLLGKYKSYHSNGNHLSLNNNINNNENDSNEQETDLKSNIIQNNGDSNRLPLQNNNINKQQQSNRHSLDPSLLLNQAQQLNQRGGVQQQQQQQQQQNQSKTQSQVSRKDFERAFSMIEFPKATQTDVYFLPNTNNYEFVMCLGLEEVVKCVKDKQAYFNEEFKYEYPHVCTTCQSDYTPSWRKDKDGKIVCEKCLKSAEKRSIRHEHMSRLKQVFSKVFGKDKQPQQILTNGTTNGQSQQPQPQQQVNNNNNRSINQSRVSTTPNSNNSNNNRIQTNINQQQKSQQHIQSNKNQMQQNSNGGRSSSLNQQQKNNQKSSNNKNSNMSNNSNNMNNPLAQFNLSQFASAQTPAAQQLQLQQAAFLQRFLSQSSFGQINSPAAVAAAIAAATAGSNGLFFDNVNWKP